MTMTNMELPIGDGVCKVEKPQHYVRYYFGEYRGRGLRHGQFAIGAPRPIDDEEVLVRAIRDLAARMKSGEDVAEYDVVAATVMALCVSDVHKQGPEIEVVSRVIVVSDDALGERLEPAPAPLREDAHTASGLMVGSSLPTELVNRLLRNHSNPVNESEGAPTMAEGVFIPIERDSRAVYYLPRADYGGANAEHESIIVPSGHVMGLLGGEALISDRFL